MPRVGPLIDHNSLEVGDDVVLTEMLNYQLSSVFSAQNPGDVPMPALIFKASTDEKLLSIKVNTSIVLKKLSQLRVDKSVSSDDISPRLLKALSPSPTINGVKYRWKRSGFSSFELTFGYHVYKQ